MIFTIVKDKNIRTYVPDFALVLTVAILNHKAMQIRLAPDKCVQAYIVICFNINMLTFFKIAICTILKNDK